MTKKIILIFSIILCSFFIFTYSLATNELKDAAEDVRNGVGNVENGIENVAKDVTGAIRNGSNDVERAGENMTNDMSTDNSSNNGNDDQYSATRTATGTLGTSNMVWTWIILAIIAAAIIGLVWYYAMQKNNTHNDY